MKIAIKKYMVIAIAICVGCAAVLSSGCNKMTDSKSSEKDITSFAFKKADNDFLDADITGVIDQAAKTVSVTVPEAAYKYANPSQKGNRKFKASFTVSPKAKLYKGTVEQKNGITEDLFIYNKEYKVVAEDGSSKTYTVRIKIEYATPAVDPAYAETIKQFYGTYRGKLHFDNNDYKMWAVFDAEKSISYSNPMSAIYTNMRWEKVSDIEWICRTYHKKDFERKTVSNAATFTIGADGKITCKMVVAPMQNAETTNPLQKGTDYVFAPDDGEGFDTPKEP